MIFSLLITIYDMIVWPIVFYTIIGFIIVCLLSLMLYSYCTVPNYLASVLHPDDLKYMTIHPNRLPVPTPVCYIPPNSARQPITKEILISADPTTQLSKLRRELPDVKQSYPCPEDSADVFVLWSGSPGVQQLYIDYLHRYHLQNPTSHIYTVGHAQHSPLTDDRKLQQYVHDKLKQGQSHYQANNLFYTILNFFKRIITRDNNNGTSYADLYPSECLTEFPSIDMQRYCVETRQDAILLKKAFAQYEMTNDPYQEGFNLNEYDYNAYKVGFEPLVREDIYGLKDQVAQKLALVAALRKRHPNANQYWAAHSMGNACVSGVLDNIDRLYILVHFGEEGLLQFDKMIEEHNLEWQQQQQQLDNTKNSTTLFTEQQQPPSPPAIWNFLPWFNNYIPISYYDKNVQNRCNVSRYLFSPLELMQWKDILINTPKPPQDIVLYYQKQKKFPPFFQIQQLFQNSTSFIKSWHGQMPVFTAMAEQPQGIILSALYMTKIGGSCLRPFIEKLIANSPIFLKRALVHIVSPPWRYPHANIVLSLCMNQVALDTVGEMAIEELNHLRGLDLSLIIRHQSKIMFMMYRKDGWSYGWLQDYYNAISLWVHSINQHYNLPNSTLAKNQQAFPVIDIDIEHAFMLNPNGDQVLLDYSLNSLSLQTQSQSESNKNK